MSCTAKHGIAARREYDPHAAKMQLARWISRRAQESGQLEEVVPKKHKGRVWMKGSKNRRGGKLLCIPPPKKLWVWRQVRWDGDGNKKVVKGSRLGKAHSSDEVAARWFMKTYGGDAGGEWAAMLL